MAQPFRLFRLFRLSLPSMAKLGDGSAMGRALTGGRSVKRIAPVPEQLRSVVKSAARTLRSVQPSADTVEIRVGGTSAVVPAAAFQALIEALEILEMGLAVGILPVDDELSTEEAARQMGVSRPYLVGLLEKGEIPFRKVGSHRRIRAGDLAAYLQKGEERKREAGRILDQHLDQIRSLLKRRL
jgi:excisionase family DNA binding protein